jgi:hypothetical protein
MLQFKRKMKKLLTVVFSFFISYVFAAEYAGFYSIGYERYERFGVTSSFIARAMNFSTENLFIEGFSFNIQGSYFIAIKNEKSYVELYLANLRYRGFEGTDISIGRFAHPMNKFLSLDGVSVSQITPWYFGVSGFIGVPNYLDAGENLFRDTGDLSYGGRIFLNGIKKINFNLNYYRETGFDGKDAFSVYKETAGFGLNYYNGEREKILSFDLTLDQDIPRGTPAGASARFSFIRDGFYALFYGDYFDVRNDYPFGRELILRFISYEKESRGGFTTGYDLTDAINIYAGFAYTNIALSTGESADGQIYRAGAKLTLVKDAGLSANIEVYDYESEFIGAYGVSAGFQWRFAEYFALSAGWEKAFLRGAWHDNCHDNSHYNKAESGNVKLLVYLTENHTFSLYTHTGSDNRYMDKNRWGAEIKYMF